MRIRFEDGSSFILNAELKQLTLKQRLFRAIKFFLVFLCLAIISIFIPILHFILVPAFALTAIASFLFLFRQHIVIDLKNQSCPKCNQPMNEKFLFSSSNQFYKKIHCSQCRENLHLESSI